MKKIILFVLNVFAVSALAAAYSYQNAALDQKPCERTEQAMLYELSIMGQQRTIEDHVKTSRIYSAMAQRGCSNNSKAYKQHAKASLEAAKALADVADLNKKDRLYYDGQINKAFMKTY
ncbi:MAG: hypothetical protein LBL21_04025 [Rickettsiales bacterium]|jgi:hypothetical protein|nr:hypothetical protein [Rickettsiales bacterium]